MRSLLSATIFSAIAFLSMAGCATRPQTYNPPDNAKVRAAADRYVQTVEKARVLSRTAKAQTVVARDNALKITLIAATAIENLQVLEKQVPNELKAAVHAVTDEVAQMNTQEKELVSQIDELSKTQDALNAQFEQADRDKKSVLDSASEYFANAQTLADRATEENAAAVKAEKALSWYRWHWWGSWIALGLGVAACLLFAFLKFTGRLALSSAAVAAKF